MAKRKGLTNAPIVAVGSGRGAVHEPMTALEYPNSTRAHRVHNLTDY